MADCDLEISCTRWSWGEVQIFSTDVTLRNQYLLIRISTCPDFRLVSNYYLPSFSCVMIMMIRRKGSEDGRDFCATWWLEWVWHLCVCVCVQVNGRSIEGLRHSEVVKIIRGGGRQTRLLVVDQETDELFDKLGITPTTAHLNGTVSNNFQNCYVAAATMTSDCAFKIRNNTTGKIYKKIHMITNNQHVYNGRRLRHQ